MAFHFILCSHQFYCNASIWGFLPHILWTFKSQIYNCHKIWVNLGHVLSALFFLIYFLSYHSLGFQLHILSYKISSHLWRYFNWLLVSESSIWKIVAFTLLSLSLLAKFLLLPSFCSLHCCWHLGSFALFCSSGIYVWSFPLYIPPNWLFSCCNIWKVIEFIWTSVSS